MNVFTFKPRFEASALAGVKLHTLRGHRKDGKPRAQVGERISLRVWTGRPYASKQREFAQATVEMLRTVEVSESDIVLDGCVLLSPLCCDILAMRDGFADWREMRGFFRAECGLPFCGVMVVWKDLEPSKA